jgi:hypothetical protein
MSPEQLRNAEIDGRSDLFSLAVILYQMLCGERPFGGEDIPAVTYAIVHEEPIPISRRVAGLPPALDRFFARALAKDPSSRYPNGTAFGTAFQEALADPAARSEGRKPAPGAETVPLAWQLPRMKGRLPLVGRRAWSIPVLAVVVAVAGWLALRGDEASAPGAPPNPPNEVSEATESDTGSVIDAYLATPTAARAAKAWLELDATSKVKSGSLTVLVDGAEVYSRQLSTTERGAERFFKKVAGRVQEEFDASIPIAPGEHEIVARVSMERRDEPYEAAVFINVESGESRRLTLVAGKTFGSPLSLDVN